MTRTRYDIARVHGVLVLDEPKAIHKLNLGDLAGAMGVEVVLNIGLGSYIHMVQLALPCQDPAPAAGTSQKQIRRFHPAPENEASIPVRGKFPKYKRVELTV
jgi:hypothetical protein